MPNPALGEVAFHTADAEYTLKFSTNAICEMEDRINKGLSSIVQGMDRLSHVRALLWASLRAKHPDVSMEKAGAIIDLAGMKETTVAIGKALEAYFPKASEEGDPNE